jgi:hypothetical protein
MHLLEKMRAKQRGLQPGLAPAATEPDNRQERHAAPPDLPGDDQRLSCIVDKLDVIRRSARVIAKDIKRRRRR